MKTLISVLMVLAGAAQATTPVTAPVTLAELAARADLVVLAQARDTDYFTRREIPVSGSAFLRILIPYKLDRPDLRTGDIVEVYEKGLHENECYFPNPTVFEEGRRYLLFLRRDPDDAERYRGMPQGCALEVLVTHDNRYAVRLPADGIRLADALESLARPLRFADPYAVVDDEALAPAERDAMQAAGQIEPYLPPAPAGDLPIPVPEGSTPRRWTYTQGIPLSEFRALLQLNQLTKR